jgi:penicillin-insensitive murein endopeptidase
MRHRQLGFGLLGFASLGCFATPTPLAPGLEGSVGWPHHGVQTGAVELPERGPGFARYRTQGSYYWGQPALVNGIQEAARRVHEGLPGGAPLLVGDISARHGGKISRHYSHRSGRDVDLLWYVTTLKGVSVRSPTFVRVGPDGVGKAPGGGGYVKLDVPRQWLLIKSLLSSPQVEIQWLLVSSGVESLVIEHAMAQGDDAELIWRAQNVMLEPADSLPHDDHLHLRIACSPEASVQGCEGGGPYWNWLPPKAGLDPNEDDVIELLGAERI